MSEFRNIQTYFTRFTHAVSSDTIESIKTVERYKMSHDASQPTQYLDTFMYQDIVEQPQVLKFLIEQYVRTDQPIINLAFPCDDTLLHKIDKIYLIASGSSRNVGMIAQHFFEKISQIPVEVEYSSEFIHRNILVEPNSLVIGISQSGETTDTFIALKKVSDAGVHTVALTNNPSSKMHMMAGSKMNVMAGEEKSIPATKSFTAQLMNLYIWSLYFAEQRGTLSQEVLQQLKNDLYSVPHTMEGLIRQADLLDPICQKLSLSSSLVLLGKGLGLGVVYEGALKIKETCYIDAYGYPTGEFLHGHMAILDSDTPVLSILTKTVDNVYDIGLSNTLKIYQARNPWLIIFKNVSDASIKEFQELQNAFFINIPDVCDFLSPFYQVVMLQLLALKTAILLGKDVDKPRSLKKVVS